MRIHPIVCRFLLPAVFLLAAAPVASAASKEIIQLQRDMAILQELVRQQERNTADKIAALEALLKQNLESVNKLGAAMAVIEREVAKQSDSVVLPVSSISAKVDALSNQYGSLRDAVEEANAVLGRLQQEVRDIKTHLTTLPPPSYPDEQGSSGPVSGGVGNPAAEAESLFSSGLADYQRGNFDLAKAQFQQFLMQHPDSSRASEAQYYLGAVAYAGENYEEAVRNFDLVLERYPLGTVSADAQYKKGMALLRLSRPADAAREFRAVLDRFPNSNVAPNAKALLEQIEDGEQGSKPSPLRQSGQL